jgi:hypothetical protein
LSDNQEQDGTRLEATLAEIKKIQQGNIDKVRALAGMGKALDPGSVANIKIDTFIEYFLDEEAQAAYVLVMERKIRQALDAGLAEVRQSSLVQGVSQQAGKLILPG